ncbi:MAG TPA: nucleotidyl transferase AbiEii/AbiGii toxin family protein [Symbiobacteriaceae bacterium]
MAFERFLARVCHEEQGQWALKGGYAMELQMNGARATKDLDLTLSGKRSDMDISDPGIIRELLQNAIAENQLDFFEFLVGESIDDLDGAPYGGARFPVTARLAGRIFAQFHVDIGAGDLILDPTQHTPGRGWLDFADIPAPVVRLISKEQQFAEKIHAYSVPHTQPNSRVKDLVDLFLLVDSGELEAERVKETVTRTFGRRATHAVPERLEEPPGDWKTKFGAYMQECGKKSAMAEAYQQVAAFYFAAMGISPASQHA